MYNKYLRCEIESITNVKAYIHILLAFFIRRSFANTFNPTNRYRVILYIFRLSKKIVSGIKTKKKLKKKLLYSNRLTKKGHLTRLNNSDTFIRRVCLPTL